MKLLCPEVVQTSAMDCGPASLKCLLDGFGVPVSYGRLREACQTDVDGSSIDTLEEVARDLGLDAEQEMVPADHLLDPAADVLPAIVVVRLPNGFTHFVVAWRCHGPLVQVMDPASGRRWMRRASFLRDVYRHAMPVAAADWRTWAASGQGLEVVTARLRRLGVRGDGLVTAALGEAGWRPLAALDAAARATDRLRRAGAVRRGAEAEAVLRGLLAREGAAVPGSDWAVASAPAAADGTEQVQLRGAVFVRVRGLLPGASVAPGTGDRTEEQAGTEHPGTTGGRPISPELAAALHETPARPGLDLLRLLRADGVVQPAFVLGGLALASVGAVVEAMLFRRFIDVGQALGLFGERLGLAGVVSWLLVGLLLLRLPVLAGVLGIGRRLEARLRVAFLAKIPRLGDRYLASRPTSDMAERSHSMYQLRTLPQLGQQMVGTAAELAVTAAGLVWLAPRSAWLAVTAAAIQIALPLALQKPLTERDLRVRVHEGSLARFYLDAMLGLMAVRTHGAERALGREHRTLLGEWARASRSFLRTTVVIETLQAVVGVVVGAALLASYLGGGADAAGTLLLVHWALSLPALGQELALAARQYPMLRNLTLRLLEPLGARDDGGEDDAPAAAVSVPGAAPVGVSLSLRGVRVVAAGHIVLDALDLDIAGGEHVAVVGASGAGKSTLAGLFLGWHRVHAGTVTVDGRDLDGEQLRRLRRETAWVDPAVQLWNRSLVDNLRYGNDGRSGAADVADAGLEAVLEAAELRGVIARLPSGAATVLGEGGGLVSGGEGQRVRLGRAMLRRDARLVILDEAFRGLERSRRRALYARTRALWPHATILCVTHDVAETLDFPRVLVIEGGRLVEDGPPAQLRETPSRYSAMLEAEETLRARVWTSPLFRSLEVVDGLVRERGATS